MLPVPSSPSPPPSFLPRPGGVQLAYVKTPAPPGAPTRAPAILFCPGLLSDMRGNKAVALEDLARRLRCPYLRFDYSGHGQSRGAEFADSDPRDWRADALAALDELLREDGGDGAGDGAGGDASDASGGRRAIVVGSSMGGLIALHLALARPRRVAALALVAPALGLGARAWARLDEAARAAVEAGEAASLGSAFVPPGADLAKLRFFEGARALDGELEAPGAAAAAAGGEKAAAAAGGAAAAAAAAGPADSGGSGSASGEIAVTCPVHILHGALDDVVPLSASQDLFGRLAARDAALTVVKGGDHRLSAARDLALLESVVQLLHARAASGAS